MSRQGGEPTPSWVLFQAPSQVETGTCGIQVGALSSDVGLFSLFLTQFPDPQSYSCCPLSTPSSMHTSQDISLLVPFGYEEGDVYGGSGPWPLSGVHTGLAEDLGSLLLGATSWF